MNKAPNTFTRTILITVHPECPEAGIFSHIFWRTEAAQEAATFLQLHWWNVRLIDDSRNHTETD